MNADGQGVGRDALATADVAQAVGDRVVAIPGVRAVWPGAAASGLAFPCACSPGDNLALHLALTRARPGSVVVCDAGGDDSCAYAGELMALDARARGLAGLVVAGAVRDTGALEEAGLPVFATAACPRSPAKSAAGSVGEEIVVQGVAVRPGDLIVADRDGVLVVRDADLDAITEAVAAIRAREEGIRAAIAGGARLAEQLRLSPRA